MAHREKATSMEGRVQIGTLIRGILGGVVGGIVGYFAFGWILRQGFYAMILPGSLVGLGFGACTRDRATVYGLVSAVMALGVGLYAEWQFLHVNVGSFALFLQQIHDLPPISLLMIGLGGVFGYWFGIGRTPVRRESATDAEAESPT